MAYTKQEEAAEFWLLTKGILQDSRVETEEAAVLLRWLQEHRMEASCGAVIRKLKKFFEDGYIDRFESRELIDSIGGILRVFRDAT